MPRNFVYIIMDSCRFDSYARARTSNMDKIAEGEQRYSYASWTAPSHHSIFMGQVAHKSPTRILASEVYKKEFAKWVDRLDVPDLSFKSFVPELSLAKVLAGHGYNTTARVSMPVLNPFTGMNRYWDSYELMADHNDFAGMVDKIEFSMFQPSFHFMNLGETHYPYMLKDDSLPIISGVHGVVKGMDAAIARSGESVTDDEEEDQFFSKEDMVSLHEQQVRTVEYVDEVLGALMEKAPKDTHFIIAADHGECFGEGDYFGHGPVMHEKVFEVPFLEGRKA
ncbi:sulfatase-like hydrolase/transferase [Celeribacter litoreus]|uniref:sulfatase-like hydrolase/transferase n=1 Tax=Celeribacter litoreus TaxID=2876714 RepID=UPI001CCF2A8E|nr:sulfatase-like hydrolase/transferase [Celeribacter litoreus]MCA0045076.1 sulfatase-like hydrolase/transferase [Celeribacter litoreus]